MGSLNGHIALVTGGTRGIGRSIALRLARDGASVGIVGISGGKNLEDTIKQVEDGGVPCTGLKADVSDRHQVKEIFSQMKKCLGSVDIVVNNAAITDYNKVKITLEQLGNLDKDTEILLPIGGSTFINAITKDKSKVLFDIGGGVVMEKTSDDAIKKIDKRIDDLQKTQEKLLETMQNLQNEATEISAKAQKLLAEKENE